MLLCEGGLRLGTLILQDVLYTGLFCPDSFFLAQLHFQNVSYWFELSQIQ